MRPECTGRRFLASYGNRRFRSGTRARNPVLQEKPGFLSWCVIGEPETWFFLKNRVS
ncbi:MAG: hypothetical protein F6J93_16240 [Oscillatoria sp. SIO1A7]|nr:hypothetical protein [Oscillatoria sp. SIO1A7]